MTRDTDGQGSASDDGPIGTYHPRRQQEVRGGYTLVEMIVVLVIVGVILAVSAFGVVNLGAPEQDATRAELLRARHQAILTGAETHALVVTMDSVPMVVRFLPDGRVIGQGVGELDGEDLTRAR